MGSTFSALRVLGYLVTAIVLVLAGAIAALLFFAAATSDCFDGERLAYQLVSSGVALVAAVAALFGLHRRWRRRPLGWLLPVSVPVLVVAGDYALLLVGCGG